MFDRRPNKLARALATAIVSTLTAALVTKILGRKAGLIAALASAAAHELFELPLAQQLARFGPLGEDLPPA